MAKEHKLDDHGFSLIARALADPGRFQMLQKIAAATDAPSCSCLGTEMGLAAATISHHLKELHSAGLIDMVREGKFARLHLRRDVWKSYLKRLSAL